MTDVATEMPRCRSISMKSDVAPRLILFDLTAPATWIAPPKSSSFSVSVVLPASGWLMMAKVRLRSISCFSSIVFLCRLPVYGVCRAAILPLRSGRRSDRVSPDSSCSLSLGGNKEPVLFRRPCRRSRPPGRDSAAVGPQADGRSPTGLSDGRLVPARRFRNAVPSLSRFCIARLAGHDPAEPAEHLLAVERIGIVGRAVSCGGVPDPAAVELAAPDGRQARRHHFGLRPRAPVYPGRFPHGQYAGLRSSRLKQYSSSSVVNVSGSIEAEGWVRSTIFIVRRWSGG